MAFNTIDYGQTTHRADRRLQIPRKRAAEATQSTEELFRAGPLPITQRVWDIARFPHMYANDDILNFYIHYLNQGFPNPRTYSFHTHFYTLLQQSFGDIQHHEKELFGRYTDLAVQASATKKLFHSQARVLHCDIRTKCVLNCDTLFIPVCRNEHWFMICIVNPKNFFIRQLPHHLRAKLREHMMKRESNSVASREEIVFRRVLRRPARLSRASTGDFLKVSGQSPAERNTSVVFQPESPSDDTVEPFLTYHRLSRYPATAIFFIDSLLDPSKVSTARTERHMREILRPIILFLIHRFHAELCVAFDKENVLDDSTLRAMYQQFFEAKDAWWKMLFIPQQRKQSVDCGFFALHCLEIFRHPDTQDRLLQWVLKKDNDPDNKKHTFHSIVFSELIHSKDLFDQNDVKLKRQHISKLIAFLVEKVQQNRAQGECVVLCKPEMMDQSMKYVMRRIRAPSQR